MRLAGRTALVTGAGSHGIGRAIALGFAREGASVAVHGYGEAAGAEGLAAEIRAGGGTSAAFDADFTDPAAARACVQGAIAALGRIDILVNNAAVCIRKPVLELADDDVGRMLAVNVQAYFACAQEAARDMVARGQAGRIIMVSSIMHHVVAANFAGYAATKGAIHQLVRSMALELAPHGVNVNAIAPGQTETDFNRHLLADPDVRQARTARIPIGRIAEPDDLVGAAIFLASEESAYVTGATLPVDGGLNLA